MVERNRPRCCGLNSYNLTFHIFRRLHFSERFRGNLQGALQVLSDYTLPLPSPLFVIARLWKAAEGSPEKKQHLSSNEGEAGSRNSPREALAPSPLSGNRHRATLRNEASLGSSGDDRGNGHSLSIDSYRAVPIRTIPDHLRDYDLRLSPSVHPLDVG
jgi:hypothetical protein